MAILVVALGLVGSLNHATTAGALVLNSARSVDGVSKLRTNPIFIGFMSLRLAYVLLIDGPCPPVSVMRSSRMYGMSDSCAPLITKVNEFICLNGNWKPKKV